MRTSTIVLAWLMAAHCAQAATISVEPPSEGRPAVVFVDGDLEPNDGDQFQSTTSFLSKAIIAFRSDGGSVVAGIQIGESIRLKGFATFVPENARCASACAIAWLGGARRFMSADSRIGFHAAYYKDSGQETGVGNALVGAYLNKIGLPYSAVIYITQAAPNSMTWLSATDAEKQGIDVELLGPPQAAVASAPAEPSILPTPAPTPSRPTIAGPTVPPGTTDIRPFQGPIENQVGQFISTLFDAWSGPNAEVMPVIRGVYSDTVTYYKKETSKQEVLLDKQRFIERWPQRTYRVVPGSLSTTCNTVTAICTGPACLSKVCEVSGSVDWQAANQQTSRRGNAKFSYMVLINGSGVLEISSEDSVVTRRNATQGPPLQLISPGGAKP